MSLWRQLAHGLRAVTDRKGADRDIADEVRHYLEQATADHVARGLSPEEAERIARLELGSATRIEEDVRAYGWENAVGALLSDLRYGARWLHRSPGFTTLTVLTLALGIGATTAIFSAVHPVLFESLPYPHAERILMLWDFGVDGARLEPTFGTYRELTERNRSFEALAVLRAWQPTMTGPAEPERLEGQRVSAAYFQVLGVRPAVGREFDPSDDRLNGARTVVLSDGLWRRRFGADPSIVGRPITLDDDSYLVVGIMPRSFENVLAPSAELWTTLQYDMSKDWAWGHHLRMVGRLRPGVDADRARRDVARIANAPVADFPRVPWADLKQGLTLLSLQDDVTRGVKPALLAVLGAVVLLLLIACVNVTHLLLARGAQRRSELAVRSVLGAGRARVIRQLLTESVLLAVIGGLFGIAVAAIGVRGLVALSPPGLPRVSAIRLDGTVLAFALGVSTLVGVAIGLVPALQAGRRDLQADLQLGSRRTAGPRGLTRGVLVAAEVALAIVLLISSGLLLRSLQSLFAVAPGFETSQLLTLQVQTAGHRFDDAAPTRRFFADALEAVRGVPGVQAAGFTSQLPLSGEQDLYGAHFESSVTDAKTDHSAFRYAVSPGYFEAMRIPLRRGRLLDAHDDSNAPLAAVINESLARRKFPGADPIGQRLHVGPDEGPWFTVVGVVGDVKQVSLALSQTDAVYMTTEQWRFADRVLSFVVRTRGDAAALAPAIRRAIWSVDKDQPIVRVATMEALVAASASERRFAVILFEIFAIVALALAAAGIYGVLAGSVTERAREIGVRSALGASRGNILALVVRQGMRLTALGLGIGLIGAGAASRVLVTLLYGVSRLDPPTYLGVIALLLVTAVIACWVPAWRAARVDPAITLCAE